MLTDAWESGFSITPPRNDEPTWQGGKEVEDYGIWCSYVCSLIRKVSTNPAASTVGKFVVHKDCCARVDGNRQTFSIHHPSASDPIFRPVSVPIVPGASVSFITSSALFSAFSFWFTLQAEVSLPAVDIVSSQNIEGELMAAFRGKELVFGTSKVVYYYYFHVYRLNFFPKVSIPHLLFPWRPFVLGSDWHVR